MPATTRTAIATRNPSYSCHRTYGEVALRTMVLLLGSLPAIAPVVALFGLSPLFVSIGGGEFLTGTPLATVGLVRRPFGLSSPADRHGVAAMAERLDDLLAIWKTTRATTPAASIGRYAMRRLAKLVSSLSLLFLAACDSPSASGHLSIAGATFVANLPDTLPDNSIGWASSNDGFAFMTPRTNLEVLVMTCDNKCLAPVTTLSGVVDLYAPVALPDGATVTGFSCFWLDSSSAESAKFSFRLMRRSWYETSASAMATVTGLTNDMVPGNFVRATTTQTVTEPIVSTMRNVYYVAGSWEMEDARVTDSIRFYGCQIDFQGDGQVP